MSPELPPVIAAFFHATNTRGFADFLSLFTADAHVNDEANDHYGAEIAAWIDRATADTKPTAEVTGITRDGEQFVVTARVSGSFPSSPIQLRYHFTLKDGKIAKLFIKA
ncbi:MAG: nuclear transport factor 2 family protein [Verrucomicrobia bacterium]|nr:nuclear transport factor 2 family protein [Verrucomicrobiota bacterium]